MRKWEEKEPNDQKRIPDEDRSKKEKTVTKGPVQSIETLRQGFSWVNYFKSQHPNWDFAVFNGIPWHPLAKPLYEAKVALLTTAGVYVHGQKPFNISPGIVSEDLRRQKFKGRGDWSFREIPRDVDSRDLVIVHAFYDHTDADDDVNCVFPLDRLRELEYENYLGAVAETHYGIMGYVPEYQLLLDVTAKELIPKLKSEGVDAVLVTPGDPLSHHSAAILQREIEAAGISTVSVSVCRDITDRIKVPRVVAVRFPMGNVFGHPFDDTMHFRIIKDALQTLTTLEKPGTILDLPYEWIEEE
jgi:D-proline reductase (dithiol) PrdB